MVGLGRVEVSDIGNSGSVASLWGGRRRGWGSFALVSLNVKRNFVNLLVGNPQGRKGCGYAHFGKGIAASRQQITGGEERRVNFCSWRAHLGQETGKRFFKVSMAKGHGITGCAGKQMDTAGKLRRHP